MNVCDITPSCKNFVFIGEAGSGKSEVALNFALRLAKTEALHVHFFDMDMTKPLFRSRDAKNALERGSVVFHCQEQFMDAPTLVGGVRAALLDDARRVVMDVGGDYLGARSLGGFAPLINRANTRVYCVLNAFRPWSRDVEHIDETLGKILGASHIDMSNVHFINNPNLGPATTKKEFLSGLEQMGQMLSPHAQIDFACARAQVCKELEATKTAIDTPLLPLELYIEYPWEELPI
jgi:hypothetical protein